MRCMLLAALFTGCMSDPPRCHLEMGFVGGFILYRDGLPFDRRIGGFHSVDDATAAARTLGCEVKP